MKSIKKIHQAAYSPIADLTTYSPLPSRTLQQIDPFLFLNHHGFQTYKPFNRGLPFGPHPHRGMQTVTFIVAGDIMHQDSTGNESIINAGGVQWMTAGSGLIHAEVSSSEFKKVGGDLEILQLWINLPAKHKMTKPFYLGLQKDDIPSIALNQDTAMALIAGVFEGTKGGFSPLIDVFMSTIDIKNNGEWVADVPSNRNMFFYIIKGELEINGENIAFRNLVEFNNDGNQIQIKAKKDSLFIFGHAEPFNESVVAQGPFVMNTQEEIYQAYDDYQSGKFG